jgi:hypothetical protein
MEALLQKMHPLRVFEQLWHWLAERKYIDWHCRHVVGEEQIEQPFSRGSEQREHVRFPDELR